MYQCETSLTKNDVADKIYINNKNENMLNLRAHAYFRRKCAG